jgi:hypothetical protein
MAETKEQEIKNRELRTITPGSARCHSFSLHPQYPSPVDEAKRKRYDLL